MANSCKYYTEKTLAWMLNNKVIVFLSLLSFSLFVSTWALAAQKNRALSKIDDLNAQLATTTTPAPVPNPEEPGTGDNGGTDGTGEGGDNVEAGGNGGTGDGGTGGTGEGGDNVDAGGNGGTGDGGTGGTGEGEENVDAGGNRGTGDGVAPKSRKSNAVIDENEVADLEEMEDSLISDVVSSNDRLNSDNTEIDLRSIVQNSKLLAALTA